MNIDDMVFLRPVVIGTLVFVAYLLPLNSAIPKTGEVDETTDDNDRIFEEVSGAVLPRKSPQTLPRQSPVDIITEKAIKANLPPLKIIQPSWDKVKAKFYNSGFSVYVELDEPPSQRPRIENGPLKNPYYFVNMHAHWGKENLVGGEHFMDGESYSMEIHLVHFNSKYPSFQSASKEKDGLVVIGIFVEVNDVDNNLLNPLYELISKITNYNSDVVLDSHEALQWAYSVFDVNTEYYTYSGSLTTEPFSENVVWIIPPNYITLSDKQLNAFRSVKNKKGEAILENRRSLQPLFERPIVLSALAK